MILIMTTVISYMSNFQARWYIPLFLTMIFLSEKCKFERKKYFFIPLNLYSTALFCFFFIYLSFTIYTHSTYGIEGLKSKRIYLYSFLNNEKDLKTGYTLTNARNIFFSNKFIGYRYPAYSKSILRKNYKNDIKNGIFFGINNLSDFKKKISISLDCVSSYDFQDIPVAKRNFFGTREFEKVLKILDFRSFIFKNCSFTTVKTQFLKMCGFGVKIVVAKTWGFKGANTESFGNAGCPL